MSGALLYLGRAQTADGILLKSEREFKEGMSSFTQSCETLKPQLAHNCSTAHRAAGDALVSWAISWRRNSPPWSAGLERALDEYHRSEIFLSAGTQGDRYTELKLAESKAYTEKAIGESDGQGQPLIPLRAQLDDLSKGIDSLTKVNGNADKLKQERARCYRRMATNSANPEDRKKYLELAKVF
jgi:hypothetical protein